MILARRFPQGFAGRFVDRQQIRFTIVIAINQYAIFPQDRGTAETMDAGELADAHDPLLLAVEVVSGQHDLARRDVTIVFEQLLLAARFEERGIDELAIGGGRRRSPTI